MDKQKFAVFDIDGTLFRSGLYREVFYELGQAGAIPQSLIDETSLKYREWRHRIHGNAFEEFELALITGLDATLPRLKVSDYEQAVQTVLHKRAENVYVYTRNLINRLKSEGYFLIAISGSQQEVVEPFAQKYQFDAWIGQEWERQGEYFSGNRTFTHTGKDKIVANFIEQHNLTLTDSYAVGDSNGDSHMLAMVDHPIAFNPTYELLDKALENGWKIVVERKNTSYELERNDDLGQFVLAQANHQ